MTDIVAQVRKVADLIAEISAATQEQTQGIAQVSTAVTQLDQVTQQNAALVEESAAAAGSLKHQADKLVQAVAVFKLAPSTEMAATSASARVAVAMPARQPAAARLPVAGAARPGAPDNKPAQRAAPPKRPATPTLAAPRMAAAATVAAGSGGNDDWESF